MDSWRLRRHSIRNARSLARALDSHKWCMSTDPRYLRSLLQGRDEARVPILWLALPWSFGVAWSVGVARAYLFGGLPPGFWTRLGAGFMIGQFLLVGGFGLLATWGWLYIAWREHVRVLCWSAALALLGVWLLPSSMVPIVPLFVALCALGAIIEQAVAARRDESQSERITRAV